MIWLPDCGKRATEMDCRIVEGGFSRVLTCSRSLLPQGIEGDPIVVQVQGNGIASYVIDQVYPSRFRANHEHNPLALGILE